jgi:uncharacterized protein YjbI with pentapeptide repeats
MKSRLVPIFTALTLTMAPGSFAAAAAAPAAAQAKPDESNEVEAHKLKVAETKLAALAKDAQAANAPPKVAAPVAKKKKPHAVRKKMLAKARAKGHLRVDRAVLKVVSRRLTEDEVKGILTTTRDFSGSDLSGMSLVGVDLTGVKFNRANLHLANLERADLAEADLELADLTGANLRGASLNQARLRGTRMEGTRMDGALWIDKTICRNGSVGGCIE